jgi:hypothetical protein
MMRTRSLALLTVAAGLVAPALARQEREAGWRPLFDGKSLDGWEHVGPGKMVLHDGVIRTEGGMGLLWYTREKLGNCTIRVVYKTPSKDTNSGVFIRIADKPKDEWYAVHHGYEVQIWDGADPFHSTGAVYSMAQPLAKAAKVGEWNTMDITLRGNRILVTLNGVLVQYFDPATASIPPRRKDYEPERGPRPESGYIGLQNHGAGSEAFFKEVSVRPLESSRGAPVPGRRPSRR